jgi:hypothetical protein
MNLNRETKLQSGRTLGATMNRNEIKANSLSAYGSYKTEEGETIRTQLAETKAGKWAVRAYSKDSGTEIYRGPFDTQVAAESAASEEQWQGY